MDKKYGFLLLGLESLCPLLPRPTLVPSVDSKYLFRHSRARFSKLARLYRSPSCGIDTQERTNTCQHFRIVFTPMWKAT